MHTGSRCLALCRGLRSAFPAALLFALLPWLTGTAADPPALPVGPPPPTVSVTDLGTLGGSGSTGFGVNDTGQVAGTAQMPGDKTVHAFFYAGGKMTDMGTLGGRQSEARALNDAGQVTGNAHLKGGKRHAFLWRQGRMSDLGTSRADDSDGQAINSAGQVAGRIIRNGFGSSRACLWSSGKADTLDSSNVGSSEITGINSRGELAGTRQVRASAFKDPRVFGFNYSDHAVLWGRSAVSKSAYSELGDPGTTISIANALNDSGQVAGAALFGTDTFLHACLWQSGRMQDLGALGRQDTVVYAINRAGLMVGGTNPNDLLENGETRGDADMAQYAFCCSGGRLVDLNSLLAPGSGWSLTEARSVSDTGYVTGTGLHNGLPRAYLLKLPPLLLNEKPER